MVRKKKRMVEIKAIETRYKGYRFRSRLEARWAVFFDTLGIEWEYEKEGYDLGDAGLYLPDFWLPYQYPLIYPNSGYWIEIKGGNFTIPEMVKVQALTYATKHTSWTFVGSDPVRCKVYGIHCSGNKWSKEMDRIELNGYFGRFRESSCQDIDRAILAFRGARFEHGESGYNDQ